MKEITAKRKQIDLPDFVKRSAKVTDCRQIIKEPTIIRDADTGEVIAIYAKLSPKAAELGRTLARVKYQVSERVGGLKTTSRIFGAMPRIALRSDFCRLAGLSHDSPTAAAELERWGVEADKIYKEYAPERYARHAELTDKILPEYQIKGTVFTSGIVNKNNPLKYHFDAGNFDKVFSCMIGFKDGVLGGHLAMPEYDLMLEIGNLSISLFDGQDILHGVTPIEKIRPDATRFTVVYYSLKQMWNCKPLGEELARIRQKKTERERKRLLNNR